MLPTDAMAYLHSLKVAGIEPKVIYDIGSYSLCWTNAAKTLWTNALYILFDAYEPCEQIYNKTSHQYHIGVLSDSQKTVKWYQSDDYPTGNSYYRENSDIFPENRYIIRTTESLDTIVKNRNFPLPDFIKIDVQGCELDILRGATNTLKNVKHLIIEMQDKVYNLGAPLVKETSLYLEELGYKCNAPLFSKNTDGPDGDYGWHRINTIIPQPIQLLQLVMIVKNSGIGLRETLLSYKPYIQSWCILDTGSTDGTQELIKDTLNTISGKLFEEPFVDFSTSRNRAIELANTLSPACYFQIMPDDSYILHGGDTLSYILKDKARPLIQKAIQIRIIQKETGVVYSRPMIWKTMCGYRFIYKVHEILQASIDTMMNIEDKCVYFEDKTYASQVQRSFTRYYQDVKCFLEEYKREPTNERYWFYLGRSYEGINQPIESRKWFVKRATPISINDEEAFLSCLAIAGIDLNNGDFQSALSWALEGTVHCKMRTGESFHQAYIILRKRATLEENSFDGCMTLGYYFLEQAYNLPCPEGNLLMFPYNVYNQDIPILYASESIKLKKYEIATSVLQKLRKTCTDPNIEIRIRPLMESINYSNKIAVKKSYMPIIDSQKHIVFVTDGNWYAWNGDSPKLRGSERSLVNFAEAFAKQGYKVDAFVYCSKEGIIRGVNYHSNQSFSKFIETTTHITHLIVSRHVEYLKYTMGNNVENVYVWLHDCEPVGDSFMAGSNLRSIWCLSSWHLNYIQEQYGIPTKLLRIMPNAIKAERFTKNHITKKPMSFIYSSGRERNLNHLLSIFKEVIKLYSHATLTIYCRLDSVENKEDMENIVMLSKIYPNCIKCTSMVTQDELADTMLETDYWLYPTDFMETFCITALEAQAAGCICICSNLAGLKDSVGNRGIFVKQPTLNDNFVSEYVNHIKRLEVNPCEKEKMRIISRKWAMVQTFDNISKTWFN